MKVTTLDEKSIHDIGHAFGYYDYGEETGMSAAFSGKEATANYICAYVRGVLRGGFLHTTSERDEATASLDVENETAIQEALSRLIKNKTVLIIAHRMRTVAGADQVVVLSGGIVAEQGSPAELYARKGLYTHMVDLQSASQNWTI